MHRSEHVEWARERAVQECAKTSAVAAWISFKHDMQKHEDIMNDPAMTFLFERGDDLCRAAVQPLLSGIGVRVMSLERELMRFIDGFN